MTELVLHVTVRGEGLRPQALHSADTGASSECCVDPEEARRIRQARSGNEAAFVWLLERYRTGAVRLAAHVLRGESEAEDVAQEAFIQALQHIGRLRGNRFQPWLYRIVIRVCQTRMRRASWTVEVGLDERQVTSTSLPIDDVVAAKIAVEVLLDRLSPAMRAVLVLRELEGFDYADIAEVLSIPVGTVRSRLNTARNQFREIWNEAADAK